MAAKIISGTAVAAQIREELKQEVQEMKQKHGVVPGLVTILVGENPASVSYVTGKQKTAHELDSPRLAEGFHEAGAVELIDEFSVLIRNWCIFQLLPDSVKLLVIVIYIVFGLHTTCYITSHI